MRILTGSVLSVAVAMAACTSEPGSSLLRGTWGGQNMRAEFSESGARFEFTCASATVDQPIEAANGEFDVPGNYYFAAGPVGNPPPRPARFVGTVAGSRLTVKVILTDQGTAAGEWIGWKGNQGTVLPCPIVAPPNR